LDLKKLKQCFKNLFSGKRRAEAMLSPVVISRILEAVCNPIATF
jgi:hypothetical protein